MSCMHYLLVYRGNRYSTSNCSRTLKNYPILINFFLKRNSNSRGTRLESLYHQIPSGTPSTIQSPDYPERAWNILYQPSSEWILMLRISLIQAATTTKIESTVILEGTCKIAVLGSHSSQFYFLLFPYFLVRWIISRPEEEFPQHLHFSSLQWNDCNRCDHLFVRGATGSQPDAKSVQKMEISKRFQSWKWK